MAIEVNETNEKVKQIAEIVRDYGLLIGEVNDHTYVPGFPAKPGLDMLTEANSFATLAKDLNEGIFKVLVMGKFKNGKSTFINALLGNNIMAARATATTAVIAIVEYGEHDNRVRVYRNGGNRPEILTLEQFTNDFSLNKEDQTLIENGGNCDRFSDVSYVVMENHTDLFRNGIRLIDSPGLEEANARTKTTNEFVPKANAIIFVLSAPSLFSAAERKYIADNFYGKQLRNIFFVVNRIDQLNEGQLENSVMPTIDSVLHNAFTDKNGRFDEALFKKRVFYTNAYGALCVRTNTEYTVRIGARSIPLRIGIEDTGMSEFEAALSDFLNSDDRLIATFQSTLSAMANTYCSAKFQVESDAAARSVPIAQLEKNYTNAQTVFQDLKDQSEAMSNMIKRSGVVVSKRVFNSLLSYVQTEIPREFAAELESNDTKFGIGSMLKLAASAVSSNLPGKDKKEVEAEQERLLLPITERIEAYIQAKLEIWQKRIIVEIQPDIRDLEKELGKHIHKFDLGLNQAMESFSHGNVQRDGSYTAHPLQTVFALTHGDFSLAVEGAATGGMAWSEFLGRTVFQMIVNWGIGSLFGSAIFLPAAIIEVAGIVVSSNRLPKKLLNQIAPIAFDRLKERVVEQETALEESIQEQFFSQGSDLLEKANGLVRDAEKKVNRILKERTESEEKSAQETKRQNEVLTVLMEKFSQVYRTLYGIEAGNADIMRYSNQKKGMIS